MASTKKTPTKAKKLASTSKKTKAANKSRGKSKKSQLVHLHHIEDAILIVLLIVLALSVIIFFQKRSELSPVPTAEQLELIDEGEVE